MSDGERPLKRAFQFGWTCSTTFGYLVCIVHRASELEVALQANIVGFVSSAEMLRLGHLRFASRETMVVEDMVFAEITGPSP